MEFFKRKHHPLDWDIVQGAKDLDILEALLQADRDGSSDIESLVSQLETRFKDISSADLAITDAEPNLELIEYLLRVLQALCEIKDFDVEERTEKIGALEKEILDHKAKIKDHEEKQEANVATQRELANANESNRVLREENSQLTIELSQLRVKYDDAQRLAKEQEQKQRTAVQLNLQTTKNATRYVQEVRELKTMVDDLEQERDKLQKNLEVLEAGKLELSRSVDQIESELVNSENECSRLQKEIRHLEGKLADTIAASEEREQEHESVIRDITVRLRSIKEEGIQHKKSLDEKNLELKHAWEKIEILQQEKRDLESDRRLSEVQAELESTIHKLQSSEDFIVHVRKEKVFLEAEIEILKESHLKSEKQLQALFKEREIQLRSFFFERQQAFDLTKEANEDLRNKLADAEDKRREQDETICKLLDGTIGLPQAWAEVENLKRELSMMKRNMTDRTKNLNVAQRKIEELHGEVQVLRAHVVKMDPDLKRTSTSLGFQAADADDLEMAWIGSKDGFKLDLTAYKVQTAMELEKSKAVNLQLEREIEALEVERLEMKTQLRLMSLLKGERAARLGLTAADIERLDAFAEYLKTGENAPAEIARVMEGSEIRKLNQRILVLEDNLHAREADLESARKHLARLQEDNSASSISRVMDEMRKEIQALAKQNVPTVVPQPVMQESISVESTRERKSRTILPKQRLPSDESQVDAHQEPLQEARTQTRIRAQTQNRRPDDAELIARDKYDELLSSVSAWEQPKVEITIRGIRHVSMQTRCFVVACIGDCQTSSYSYHFKSWKNVVTVEDVLNPLPVSNRDEDKIIFQLFQELPFEESHPDKYKLLGVSEKEVKSFGKAVDESWSGNVELWLQFYDQEGKVLRPEGDGNMPKTEVNVHLRFVEAPHKRLNILEVQNKMKSQQIEQHEKDLDIFRSDLKRKSDELDQITVDRNQLRHELLKSRLNVGFRPSAGLQQDDQETEAVSIQIADLNALLIKALDDLSAREEEVNCLQSELQRYSEDMSILRIQQLCLYREHDECIARLEINGKKTMSGQENFHDMAAAESASLSRLKSLSQGTVIGGPNDVMEAERRIILLESERDSLSRINSALGREQNEVKNRYDSLALEMTQQQNRLRQRIGRLDREKSRLERRLTESQRNLEDSVPRDQYISLLREFTGLKETYSLLLNESNRSAVDKSQLQNLSRSLSALSMEKQELELQLKFAEERASAVSRRLELLALKDTPYDRRTLETLSERVKLESSERHYARRCEMNAERIKMQQIEREQLDERITGLELETIEKATIIQQLETQIRRLQDELDRSISQDAAKAFRDEISRKDLSLLELQSKCHRLEEVAELASDQARSLAELQGIHKDELEALRAFSLQLQAESENAFDFGILHRKIIDCDRAIVELRSKLAAKDREIARQDALIVNLEEGVDQKDSKLRSLMEVQRAEALRMQSVIDELKIRSAGQITASKADKWAATLRELSIQKQSSDEELEILRKKKSEADLRADALTIELNEIRSLVSQLREANSGDGSVDQSIRDKLISQNEEMTKIKVESMRQMRQSKHLQERENHLESLCRQNEKEIHQLEENMLLKEQENGSLIQRNEELAKQVEVLMARVTNLESSKATTVTQPEKHQEQIAPEPAPPLKALPDGRAEHEAIQAMEKKIVALTQQLLDKQNQVDGLRQELLDSQVVPASDIPGGNSKLTIAAEHAQEVAKLTIERLEKNNERKNDLITKYQQQLREIRSEFMAQKERDALLIEDLRERLAAKTNEMILHMRSQTGSSTSGIHVMERPAAEADSAVTEKNKLMEYLRKELDLAKSQIEKLQDAKKRDSAEAEANAQKLESEVARLTEELRKKSEENATKHIEDAVEKYKRKVVEKEGKIKEMKNAIEALKEEMVKAAEIHSKSISAAAAAAPKSDSEVVETLAESLKVEMDKLKARLERMRGEQLRTKKELEGEQSAKERAQKECEEERKAKEKLESDLLRCNRELKKALKERKEALDALKASEVSAAERKKAEIENAAPEPTAKPPSHPLSPADAEPRSDSDKEKAMRRWEAEKRLEAKVQDLREKLRDQRKELDTLERQRASDLDKATREGDRLRQQIEKLEGEKKAMRAQLRGTGITGEAADSDELVRRVREAEKGQFEAQEQVEKLKRILEVDNKEKEHEMKQREAALERQVRELQGDKESLVLRLEALSTAENSSTRELENVKEIRRLENQSARLRDQFEELERDLLASQNQVLRLRFEEESSSLRLQRWKRRVRELESLATAASFSEASAPLELTLGRSKGAKEEEDVERFVRTTKAALERLHRENESLRGNSSSNVKYMELLRETKANRAALADRDKELAAANERLARAKELADKRARAEERCHLLEKQLRDEMEKHEALANRLREKERQVARLEDELQSARAALGGVESSARARGPDLSQISELEDRLDRAERSRNELQAELSSVQRQLASERRKIAELDAASRSATDTSGQDVKSQLHDLREEVRKLQVENQELKAELDSFDPAFFDEIEDLKYNHNEMKRLVERYEALLHQLSARYGFDYSPLSSLPRSGQVRTGAR